jgi:hypothetical protein
MLKGLWVATDGPSQFRALCGHAALRKEQAMALMQEVSVGWALSGMVGALVAGMIVGWALAYRTGYANGHTDKTSNPTQ